MLHILILILIGQQRDVDFSHKYFENEWVTG